MIKNLKFKIENYLYKKLHPEDKITIATISEEEFDKNPSLPKGVEIDEVLSHFTYKGRVWLILKNE